MFIDGKIIAQELLKQISLELKKIPFEVVVVDLVMKSDEVGLSFVRRKKKTAEQLGVSFRIEVISDAATTESLSEFIQKLNVSANLCGIIVQQPLPYYINAEKVLGCINPGVDIDCLTATNRTLFEQGKAYVVPPTAAAIWRMLESLGVPLHSKRAVVVGQGKLVGKPTTTLLRQKGLDVHTADITTVDIARLCRSADILIAAAGSPGLITADFLKPGVIVIDAGTSEQSGVVVGDVALDSVLPVVSYISPVPGGVGPVMVAELFANALRVAVDKSTRLA